MDYARHNAATKRSSNPYVDNYTGFTWNNIHSSRFNCFIENTGHLSFEPAPAFSNNFVNPLFQNRNYYTGTQSQTKKIQLQLIFYKLTLADLNEAVEWLNRTTIGELFFDYEPYWKYCCKLASIGTMEKYVDGYAIDPTLPSPANKQDLYIGRVEVTFETVYQPDAASIYTVYHSSNYPASNTINNVEPTTLDWIHLNQFFNPAVQAANLVEHRYHSNPDNTGYWEIIVRNPSLRPTFFKLHCYDITSSFQLNYIRIKGVDETEYTSGTVDVNTPPIIIAQATLSLETGHQIHLHYNSEDGSLLTANQSIESLQGLEHRNICIFAQSLADMSIPSAKYGHNGELHLELYGSNNWSIEYDIYNNLI